MKYVDEFRAPGAVGPLISEIARVLGGRKASLMEVCGTHTVAIFRSGLAKLLPPGIRLLSGPGCPVCVTSNSYIDRAIALARLKDATVVTFGDMFRVPGSTSSLEKEKAQGADVRMVYSPIDSLGIAERKPERNVVFLGVGFETTTPAVAATILEARRRGLRNFFVLCGHKVVPPALQALASDRDLGIDGFILPGHVSTILGSRPYEFLAKERRLPCVIAGFEPVDVAQAVLMLARQLAEGRADVEIQYRRSVRPEGNPKALAVMDQVLRPCDSTWRGIGLIPGSGLELRPDYSDFDARRIPVTVEPERTEKGCICGAILRGVKSPKECPLFGTVCTPEEPVGACMVSSEGTCAAHHRYARED